MPCSEVAMKLVIVDTSKGLRHAITTPLFNYGCHFGGLR
jgi:hypothetical protein